MIGEPLEDLADIRDPEGPLKASTNLVQAFGKGQKWLPMPLFVAPASCRLSRRHPALAGGRESPLTALHSNPSAYFFRRHSRHANDLIPAGLAGRYRNGRTGYIQKICQEFDTGRIRPTFDRRRGQSQFQRAAYLPDKGILFGAGLHLDREGNACRRVANRNHGFQRHHKATKNFNHQVC